MILEIDNIIKTAVLATIPGAEYLRASDINANKSIAEIDLGGKVFVLFENMPRTRTAQKMATITRWPVIVRFMEKDTLFSNTSQGDEIRDRQWFNAFSVFNKIVKSADVSRMTYPEDCTIELGNNLKLYDSILTGVSLEFEMFITPAILC